MKISKVSTGNKLNVKTFGELEEGDKLYFASSGDKTIEDVTCTVKGLFGKGSNKLYAYTDLNPDKQVDTLCDIALKIETKFGDFNCYMPSAATYFVAGSTILATSQELMFQVIKKYKLEIHLV